MFGKLSLEAVPFHEPIVMVTLAVVALLGAVVFGLITYYKKWTYLWTEQPVNLLESFAALA